MTINSEVRVAGPFLGNNVTVDFPFTFKVFDTDEVLVVRASGEGIEQVLDLDADYTVALNVDQEAAPGGVVTLLAGPLPSGESLALTSALAPLQPVDLTNQGGFYPRVINVALDRLTILIQQLSERLGRSLVVPISDGESGGTLPSANERKGTVLAFNKETGAPQVGPSIAAVGTVAANAAAVNTVAANIADVGTVADNITDVTNFADVYYGPSANDPTTRRDGSPLQRGDLYFNTTIDALRSFNGSAWRGVPNGSITVQNLSGDGSETEFLLDYAPENEAVTSVFISGVYQQKNTYELGGAGGAWLIFDEAPPAGADNIEVVVSALQPSDDKLRQDLANSTDPAKGAALIGRYGRTVASKLDETLSLADFGAVGNGIANDQAAVQNALAAGVPLRWVGTAGRTFRIETPVSGSTASDVIWYGEGARIVYAGAHAEFAVRLEATSGNVFLIDDIEVDGAKLCNKPFEIRNLTSMTTASRLIATNMTVRRAKRSNVFSGGDGMLVRGAFDIAQFNQCRAIDCELPAGQGTVGSVGISGISVAHAAIDQYCRRAVFDGVCVDKIYSSDPAYQHDQDGIRYFAPHTASGGAFVESQLVVCGGSRFVNCYGRSIKVQAFSSSIGDSYFERTEGLSSGVGNVEIDSQVGSASFSGLQFNYKNGFQPGFCVVVGTDAGYPRTSSIVDNCEVHLDSATTLGGFASNYPRGGIHSNHDLRNVRVFGKVMHPVRLLCNGDRNFLNVENFDIQEIVLSANTSDRSLIQVLSSGAITPYYAYVTASNNIYRGAELPAIVRDGVPGVAMFSTVSAWGNIGFAEDRTRGANASGLKTDQIARLGRIGPRLSGRQDTGYFDVDTQYAAAGASVDFDVRNQSGSIVFITVERNNTSYAVIASGLTTNVTISAGSSFAVGNAVDPGTNTFRVWSIGDNKIRIFNNDVSTRVISVFVMCPR